MTSSYQGLAGNISPGSDPSPGLLPGQEQAFQQLQQGINLFNQSVNANDAALLENAKKAGDTFKDLASLSDTLGKALGMYQTEQIKKYRSEAEILAALKIFDQETLVEEQNKLEQEQQQTQGQLDAVADKAAKDGKPLHVIQGIKKLNAYHLSDLEKLRAANLASQVTTKFTDYFAQQGGPDKSRSDQLALANQFYTNELDQFAEFSPGVIAKYVLPVLQKARQEQQQQIDFQWGQNTSAQITDEAINTLFVDGNLGKAVSSLATTVDKKGVIRGSAGAYRYLVETVLPKAIKANLVSVTDVQEMFDNSEMPGMNGKTYGQLKKVDVNTLIETAEADINADFRRNQTARNNAFIEWEQAWIANASQADPSTITPEFIEQSQLESMRLHDGKRSKAISTWGLHATADALQIKEADRAAQRLIESNSLTTERLRKFPWQIQQKYLPTATATDKVAGDNYKVQEDAIKDAVEKKASVTPLGTRDPSVGVVTSIYQAKFHENLRQQLEAGNPNALNDALSITLQEFNAWSALGTGNFTNNGFNIFADSATAQNLQANARVEQERVNSIIRTYGVRSLDQVGLVNSTVLRNDAANFGQRGFKHHPQIQRISRILQVDPITATNKMIEAYNLANQAQGNPIPLISLSPAAVATRDDLPAQAKALYLANQDQMTPKLSLRVLSQLPGDYRPEMVPLGFGELIGDAAKKYDIPASILAGLFEQESRYRKEVIYDRSGKYDSRSGAKGVAQIIPRWHPTVKDPYDPNEAIPYAASYLRRMMDTYGWPLRVAIFAYNTGEGNVREKIGVQNLGSDAHRKFSQENFDYLPGVLERAVKYGYKTAFRDPSMMRPVFR